MDLTADGQILQQANAPVIAIGDGGIQLQARGSNSGIHMNSAAFIQAESGQIRLSATTDIQLALLQSSGSVTVQSTDGGIVDNNDDVSGPNTNIIAENLLLQAVTIGIPASDFFNGMPQPLEISLTGHLSVEAREFAALRGSEITTDSLQAKTLFLISDDHLSIKAAEAQFIGSLALIADADNDGVGTLTLEQPIQVSDRLRLQASTITGGSQGTDLSAPRILVRSAESLALRISQGSTSNVDVTEFDGRAGEFLSVSSEGNLTLTDLDGDGLALTARSAADAYAQNLLVSADVRSADSIELRGDDSLQVGANAGSSAIRLTSSNDALIFGSLDALNSVTIRAGLGTVGSIAVTSTGSIVAGNSTTTGTILLSTGSITGDQQIDGQLQAGERITLAADGGLITGIGTIKSTEVLLTAGTGMGGESPLQLTAARVFAESANGMIRLTNTRESRFTRVATGEGVIDVAGQGSTIFEDVLTSSGDISLNTSGGNLTVVLGRQQFAGDIRIATADSGDVAIGFASAGGTLIVNSAGSIFELGQDPDSDLQATSIALEAHSGIGTAANSIESSDFRFSLAAVTETGGINLSSFNETLITEVNGIAGLQITDASLNSPGTIRFNSPRTVTVAASVLNLSGGNLELTSGEHLIFLPGTTISTAGQGNIVLQAGDRPPGSTVPSFGGLRFSPDTLVATEHGNITLTATSVNLFRVQSLDGNITVRAALNNSEGRLTGDSEAEAPHISTQGFVSLYSGSTEQSQTVDLKVAVGGLEATLLGGTLQLTAFGSLTIAGIGLQTAGDSSDIQVLVNDGGLTVAAPITAGGDILLIADNNVRLNDASRVTTSGDGAVIIEARAGDLNMQGASSITSGSGSIDLSARNNLLITSVSSDIGTLTLTAVTGSIIDNSPTETLNLATAGAVWLQAGLGIGGSLPAGNLNLSAGQMDAVSNGNGIFLTSPDSITVTRNGLVSTGSNAAIRVQTTDEFSTISRLLAINGNISVTAASVALNGQAELQALDGDITIIANVTGLSMSTDSLIGAAGDVVIRTVTDAFVGNISAQQHLLLTSQAGAIIDANDTAGVLRLNLAADSLSLDAATGIGSENPLEISTTRLVAQNASSGDLRLTQVAAAGNLGLELLRNSDRLVSLTVAGGALNDINDDGNGIGLNLQASDAQLQARDGIGGGNPLETQLDSLTASVTGTGNLEFSEFDSLRINGLQTTGSAGILVTADQNLLIEGNVQASLPTGGSTGSPGGGQREIRLTGGENLRLAANARVTSALNHSISLLAGNDITMLAGSVVASNGGDLLIRTDPLTGGNVLVQDVATTGSQLTIVSGGDIRIGDSAPVQLRATNGDPTRSEQIVVDAAGDIRVADGVVITTDGDPTARASANQTGDRLLLIARGRTAGSNQPLDSAVGRVQFDGRVTLRTDGGVATTFLGRPTANATTTTAFFDATKAESSPQGRLIFPGLLRPRPKWRNSRWQPRRHQYADRF